MVRLSATFLPMFLKVIEAKVLNSCISGLPGAAISFSPTMECGFQSFLLLKINDWREVSLVLCQESHQ